MVDSQIGDGLEEGAPAAGVPDADTAGAVDVIGADVAWLPSCEHAASRSGTAQISGASQRTASGFLVIAVMLADDHAGRRRPAVALVICLTIEARVCLERDVSPAPGT